MKRATRHHSQDPQLKHDKHETYDRYAGPVTPHARATDSSAAAPPLAISRRGFLLTSAVMGALAVVNLPRIVPLAYATDATGTGSATAAAHADFVRLSAFLTSRDTLDDTSATRFLSALSKRDAAFGRRVSALLGYIDSQKFAHMDDFLSAAKDNAEQMATATHIVSAWYLGIVGAARDAELITYESALMYAPTKGVLAVPTYGPGPLAWGETPAGAGISDRPDTLAHA